MSNGTGTLERIAQEIGVALASLEALLDSSSLPNLLVELGLDTALDVGGDPAFVQKLNLAAQKAGEIGPQVDAVAAAADGGDDTQLLDAVRQLLTTIGELASALDEVATDFKRAATGGIDPAVLEAFVLEMVDRIFENVLVRYLESRHPVLWQVLSLLTIVEYHEFVIQKDDDDPVTVLRRRFHFDRIGPLFSNPLDLLEASYGWGTEQFDGNALFSQLADTLESLQLLNRYEEEGDDGSPALDVFAVRYGPTKAAHPPGLEATLFVDLSENDDITLAQITDNVRLAFQVSAALKAGLVFRVLPPAKFEADADATVAGSVALALFGANPDGQSPFLLFGETGGSRLQAVKMQAGAGANLKFDAAANVLRADAGFEAKFVKGTLFIDTSKADGFLQTLLPSDGLTLNFDFDLGWTAERGFFFSGSAGLETTLALGISLGPLELDALHLLLAVANDKARIETSLDAGGSLGPISASVERIGVALDLKFSRGNLGPVDLGIAFKPPTGLGIAIDAGPITGGGFIEFDPAQGRYTGVLALSLYSIQIKAIGLLDTKLPNGESGYSFLIIISVEFSPIQLGFGFTLNGVGGLCGINRNFVTDAIQAGLRAHSLDHILFPKDPIKNAPAIISDLRAIFPPAAGRYVFGPMLEIGWGGGVNLLTAELGVIFAVPSPIVIAILGQVNVTIPNPDAPVIDLHLDVLGIIDVGKKLFSLDATLHDSRIIAFTIYGDMALRLTWGDNPSFALSIGGLNPHFQPPPGFPTLKRLTIALSSSGSFRLSIQTYLAITSNTFQIGVHAELYAGAGSFNVYGWLGFDALFIFKPFSFVVDVTAGMALRSGTSTLMGITFNGELSGPTPWHVKGEAHISLLFFDIGVDVDVTWGESHTLDAPPTDAWPPLHDAIADARNWSGALPPSTPAVATLAKPGGDDTAVLVEPSGALTLRERVLPLDQLLTKFGESVPGPQTTFTLDHVRLGGQIVPFAIVRDKFAPAQFEEMSDQDKLSRPSFEDRDAGFSVGTGAVAFGKEFGLDVVFNDIYMDDEGPRPAGVKYPLAAAAQLAFAQSNGAARSPLRLTAMGKYAPAVDALPLVALRAEAFVIATTSDFQRRDDITKPVTKGEAFLALAAHLAAHPQDRDTLQVVPLHEVAA
jgi:hypothetical protein